MTTRSGERLTRRQFIGASATTLAGFALLGCEPGRPSSPAAPSRAVTAAPDVPGRSAQTTINFATTGTVKGITDVEGFTSPAQPEIRSLCHCPISGLDHDGRVVPMLAERLPSVDDGTWVINPDGTMQITWNLRRNVTWHDGQPFTARDVRFSWEFVSDRSIPQVRFNVRPITAVDVPDDYTAVLHYSALDNFANLLALSNLFIYPEHIVRPLWESGEGERILSNDFFLHGFVGLGPYRIDRWNVDESIVFKPHDAFFLGEPKIGTIVVHQPDSSQAILTRLLAGEIQMAGAYGLNFGDGLIAQEQWEGSGQGKVYWTPVALQRISLPPRVPQFRDVRVRKALLLAIDRDELNHTLLNGTSTIGHTLLHPNEPGYQAAERVITKYPFDPRQALALFEQAGWTRGTDGVLANAEGLRMEFPYRAQVTDAEQLHMQSAIANFWKDVGVRVAFDNVPLNVWNDAQEKATFPGTALVSVGTTNVLLPRVWANSSIPRPENRYVGDNVDGWDNPAKEQVLAELGHAFTPAQLDDILSRLAKLYSDDLPSLPMYYKTEPIAISNHLKNARPRANSGGANSTDWDAYLWEWE